MGLAWGFGSVNATGSAGITTTSGTVLAANQYRRFLRLQNDSDTVIYVAIGGTAAFVNSGIRLPVNGDQPFSLTVGKGNVYTGPVHAIQGGSGTKILLVVEGSESRQ